MLGKGCLPAGRLAEDMYEVGMKCENSPTGRHEWDLPAFRLGCKWCDFVITEELITSMSEGKKP